MARNPYHPAIDLISNRDTSVSCHLFSTVREVFFNRGRHVLHTKELFQQRYGLSPPRTGTFFLQKDDALRDAFIVVVVGRAGDGEGWARAGSFLACWDTLSTQARWVNQKRVPTT